MGLKKPSASPMAAGAPTTATTAPAAVAGGEPSTTSAPPASSAPPTPAPAAQARDLAAMRARLVGGQLGGVNSPEGAEKITEALVAPRTITTANGGAEPIPAAEPAQQTEPVSAPKRTRRTKAEMEAARAAASAASTPEAPEASVESSASSAPATHAPAAGSTDPVVALLTEIRDLVVAIERAR